MRNYIDILSEYVDFRGDSEGGVVVITDILWDTDTETELPSRVVATLDEIEEAADPYADDDYREDMMSIIGQWLQSTYNAGLSDFNYTVL